MAPSLAGRNPLPQATAGVDPNGTDDGDFEFFRNLMESNTPPPGIGATNSDWYIPRE